MSVRILNSSEWKLSAAAPAKGVRRGRAAAVGARILPAEMLPADAELGESGKVQRQARRTRGAAGAQMEVDTAPGERVILVTRLPSGALRFHAPVERAERRARGHRSAGGGTARFVIPPAAAPATPARRGWISDAFDWVVVKIKETVVDRVTGAAFRFVAKKAEQRWWGKTGEGLYRVEESGGALRLTKAAAAAVRGPALLFLHGTFSNALSAFGDLAAAPGGFFAEARKVYGDNIYAWNHYTVSKAPEDNAQELLAALPAGGAEFDVITHSRGGLVLRLLAERPDLLGSQATRFRLRRAVLVACPNAGTPLATPERWEQTIGAIANLLELFPGNPWATGAKFVADGIVWLAAHASGDLPGLHSMDANGETIAELQDAGPLAGGEYSALAANYHPDDSIWQRILDAGIDSFFSTANDLVVPSEGSWLADGPGTLVPANRIACFGEGGNLDARVKGVHHLNFFRQAATVDFLLKSLRLTTGALPPPLDPDTELPARTLRQLLRRGGRSRAAAPARSPAPPPGRTDIPPRRPQDGVPAQQDTAYLDRTLHLVILERPADGAVAPPADRKKRQAVKPRGAGKTAAPPPEEQPFFIYATYSNARLIAPFPTKDGQAGAAAAESNPASVAVSEMQPGKRFQQIIAMHRDIEACLNGTPDSTGEVPELPGDDALTMLGELLFRALFVGDIRRLYDMARAEQGSTPLNIVLTSAVPWLAALPWEFAFDPVRRKFLASEEVHFTRGVMAAVPAEVISRRSDKLRILVIGAQPRDATPLSIAEEEERLRHAFRGLTAEGLAEIETLLDASPGALHEYLLREEICQRPFDVVHFISHGEYAPGSEEGRLLFVGRDGWQQEVEVRPLREILCSRGIHLVFLNACESATGWRKVPRGERRRGRERGVAQALVEGGLPAVVGNQYTVLDSSAVTFAECFYRALALGASLGQAAREARISLNYAVDGDCIDWAVPVLFARDPDKRLCSLRCVPYAEARALAPVTAGSRRSSRGGTAARIRVGVADISRFFPRLPDIVAALNKAQPVFEFSVEEVAIPLGVWELYDDPDSGETVRFLHANRFSEKTSHMPQRLGVDYLLCVTNHWLRDGDWLYLFGWWSGKEDRRVLLFSTAGLTLPSEGPGACRVVANSITQGLASQMTEERGAACAIHADGSENCPFFFNGARDSAIVSSRETFDASCRTHLKKHLPKTLRGFTGAEILKAFDQLLAAF